jgi:hypothetical protein
LIPTGSFAAFGDNDMTETEVKVNWIDYCYPDPLSNMHGKMVVCISIDGQRYMGALRPKA